MKEYILMLMVMLTLFAVSCEQQPAIGGERDEHGCLAPAGYRWCEAAQKCQRFWEDPCSFTKNQAVAIAEESACIIEGKLTETIYYNDYTRTWWIDMSADAPGCAPACVISEKTGAAQINWRCTGVIPE